MAAIGAGDQEQSLVIDIDLQPDRLGVELQDFLNSLSKEPERKFVDQCGGCQRIKHVKVPQFTSRFVASLPNSVPLESFARGDSY